MVFDQGGMLSLGFWVGLRALAYADERRSQTAYGYSACSRTARARSTLAREIPASLAVSWADFFKA